MSTALREMRDPDALAGSPNIRVLGYLSLAVLVLNSSHDPVLFAAAAMLLAAGLFRSWVVEAPVFWLGIAAAFGVRSFVSWEGVDNHVFLTIYWCLAFGCALLALDPMTALGRSGRLLTGLAFLFATGWKVFTPTFASSEFFQFTLLVDARFRSLATSVGGISEADHAMNQASLDHLATSEFAPVTVELAGSAELIAMATALTVGTIFVEALVAVAYLVPLASRWRWIRPATLATFCASTYLLVPVSGFGAVLIVMTLADPALSRRWRQALLVLLVVVVAYAPVWRLAFG